MKEPKDKRTKAYKKWLAKEKKSQINLGDKVAKITEATGIKKFVGYIFNEDCGCAERQEALNTEVNKLFGRTHTEPLTEDEYNYIMKCTKQRGFSIDDQTILTRIYERVFAKRVTTSCVSCSFVTQIWNPLEKLFNAYNEK